MICLDLYSFTLPASRTPYLRVPILSVHFIELNSRKMGYDAGFIRDEYDCISDKCKCAIFDQTVIGKSFFFYFRTDKIIQVILLYLVLLSTE